MKAKLEEARLYGICDLGYLALEDALSSSRELLEGGVGVLQLRAKEHDPNDLLDLAKGLRDLCEEFEIPFVVNDHLQLARDSKAQGLHLGQNDGPLQEARNLLPEDVIIGRSTHSLQQAQDALAEGADYIGFGPLFPTPTKLGRPGIGLDDIKKMEAAVGCEIPAFCIGGIIPDRLEDIRSAGARRVVVVSHLLQASNIIEATHKILQQLI